MNLTTLVSDEYYPEDPDEPFPATVGIGRESEAARVAQSKAGRTNRFAKLLKRPPRKK